MRVFRSEPVSLPRLPNYLRTDSGACIDVATLSDAGCRELGRLWTQALIRHARNRRKGTAYKGQSRIALEAKP